MRWKLRRDEPQLDGGLVSETERFLGGRYLEIAFAKAGDLPSWVWWSVIAHGDEEVLVQAETWLGDHAGLVQSCTAGLASCKTSLTKSAALLPRSDGR